MAEFHDQMISEDEIKAAVEAVLKELGIESPASADKGRIMKNLMPKVKGKADGSLVNNVVSSYIL